MSSKNSLRWRSGGAAERGSVNRDPLVKAGKPPVKAGQSWSNLKFFCSMVESLGLGHRRVRAHSDPAKLAIGTGTVTCGRLWKAVEGKKDVAPLPPTSRHDPMSAVDT